MKTALRILLGLVVIVAIVVAVVWVRIDALAKSAIERGGTYALGVDTTVEGVSISLWGGSAAIGGLNIANPAGYPADFMLNASHLGLAVEPGSIRTDTVVVNQIIIDGLELNIEKADGKYNVEVISDNLKKFSKDEEEPAEEEPTEPGKQYVVQKLVIRNITAHVDGPTGKVTVTPPDIELTDVTKDNVPLDQLIAQLYPAIMMSVVQALPANLSDLSGRLTSELTSAAEAIGGGAAELLEQSAGEVTRQLGNIGEGATKAVGEQVENIGEGAGKAVENTIGNLLGGNKDANDQ